MITCLTDQEERVLMCMFYGMSDSQATSVIGVTRARVGYLRRKAFRKLGVRNVVEAVRVLCRAGWDDEGYKGAGR